LNDFFGGFISLNISKQKFERVNEGGHHYEIQISHLKYVELVSNKNNNILKRIPEKFIGIECIYGSLHNIASLQDFYTSDIADEDHDYYFIDTMCITNKDDLYY